MLEWITIQKMHEESGYTVAALRAKIRRGQFIEGIHFKYAPDGRVHFNVKAFNQWIEGIDLVLQVAA